MDDEASITISTKGAQTAFPGSRISLGPFESESSGDGYIAPIAIGNGLCRRRSRDRRLMHKDALLAGILTGGASLSSLMST